MGAGKGGSPSVPHPSSRGEHNHINPKEHDHLCERDPGPGRSSSRLCPSSNCSPPCPWDPSRLLRCGLVCWKPNPYIFGVQHWEGINPIMTDLSISGQGYICTGIYVAIYISMCFLKLQFEIHWYL